MVEKVGNQVQEILEAASVEEATCRMLWADPKNRQLLEVKELMIPVQKYTHAMFWAVAKFSKTLLHSGNI